MMMRERLALTGGIGLLWTLAGGGCGDLTSFKFDLPAKTYTFDTAQAGLSLPAGVSLPAIPCGAAADCCAPAMLAVPGVDCSKFICDTGSCAISAVIETPPPQQTIDLKKEVSGLSSFSSQSVIDVTISQISYDITQNTMNVDLPAIELFVAPQGTNTTSDPAATRFGTVPPTTAGTTLTGGKVALDAAGQNAFKGFAHNFGTPFVFMARTTLVVGGGTPVPMGAVTLTVKGQLKATPGL